jgi:hypothetical protein
MVLSQPTAAAAKNECIIVPTASSYLCRCLPTMCLLLCRAGGAWQWQPEAPGVKVGQLLNSNDAPPATTA